MDWRNWPISRGRLRKSETYSVARGLALARATYHGAKRRTALGCRKVMHMLATPPAPELAQNALPNNVDAIVAAAALRARTGRSVHRVDVREIDFLRESAQLLIYFHPASSGRVT